MSPSPLESPVPLKHPSEASPQGGDAVPSNSALRPLTLRLLAATGVLLFSVFLVFQDLSGANRPHELHNAPWVAGLTLLNLVLCTGVLKGLVRYTRARRGRSKSGLKFVALAVGLAVVATLSAFIFAGAVSLLPAVLGVTWSN
jgi:hypothetical protein